MRGASGYRACTCRDCFGIAIGDFEAEECLCSDCDEAGCDGNGSGECQAPSDEEQEATDAAAADKGGK